MLRISGAFIQIFQFWDFILRKHSKNTGGKSLYAQYIMIGEWVSKFIHYTEHYAAIKIYLHQALSTAQKYTSVIDLSKNN